MDTYECELDNETLKKAKAELHEDPNNRMGAVWTLREWIQQQPHIKCKTDARFLIRFLRVCKYSQLEARKRLQRYLGCLEEVSQYLRNIDSLDPAIQSFIDTEYIIPLPGRDDEGRKVIIMRPGIFDTKKFSKATVFKAVAAAFFYYSWDDMTQINGFVYIMDMTGFDIKHKLFFGMDDIRTSIKIWQHALPARFKKIHYYNVGPVFETVFNLVLPVISKKIKDRVVIHGSNLESLYQHIPLQMLPEEYLPDEYTGINAGTIPHLVSEMKQILSSPQVRNRLLEETGNEFGIDVKMKSTPKEEMESSFRKLNVD